MARAFLIFLLASFAFAKNPIGINVYLEDTTGLGMVIKNDTIDVSVYDTAGVLLWTEKEAVHTMDGSFSLWIGEERQDVPDRIGIELSYRGKKYGIFEASPVIYAVKNLKIIRV